MTTASSHPELQGALNFRDLGGLPLADGRSVRLGRLFRSDTLQALTSLDAGLLTGKLGLRTVVDLRLADEVAEQGRGPLADFDQVRFVDAPLEMASITGLAPDEVLDRLYERCLASPSLPRAIGHIAAHCDAPTLFHCAAGKDRTGIVAALVLALIGVDEEAIVADYLRSGLAMPRMLERFMQWPRYRVHVLAMPPEVYAVDERPICRLLAGLRDEFGDVRTWAKARGLTASTLARLETHLVDPL